MAIEWLDEYSVGVKTIDMQHQMLFAKIAQLAEAMQSGQSKQAVGAVLDFLAQYTRTHFDTEERWMAELGYPEREFHLREHGFFVATLNGLKSQFEQSGPTATLAIAVNGQVFSWLRKHVLGTDQKLGAFLKANGKA
jgi:hemerythrin